MNRRGIRKNPTSDTCLCETLQIQVELEYYLGHIDTRQVLQQVCVHGRVKLRSGISATLFTQLQELVLENYTLAI